MKADLADGGKALLRELERSKHDLVAAVFNGVDDAMSSRETTPLPHEGDASRPGAFLVERTSDAEEAMDRFARAGVHVVRSTDPMASWPGMG